MEEKIIEKGGRLSNGVSKNLTYLIVKNANSTSTKAQKAKKYGVEILTEEELNKILFNTLF